MTTKEMCFLFLVQKFPLRMQMAQNMPITFRTDISIGNANVIKEMSLPFKTDITKMVAFDLDRNSYIERKWHQR